MVYSKTLIPCYSKACFAFFIVYIMIILAPNLLKLVEAGHLFPGLPFAYVFVQDRNMM